MFGASSSMYGGNSSSAASSMYGGSGQSQFGMMGGSGRGDSMLSGDGMADIMNKAGSVPTMSSPVTTDLSKPYVPQSARQREQIRGNAPKSNAPAIADDLMQMLRAMPTKPTIQPQPAASSSSMMQAGAPEQKEAAPNTGSSHGQAQGNEQVRFESPGDFLFRDKDRTPEERKQLQRIRQPMSPMIHSMLRSKDARDAREETKPVAIGTHATAPQQAAPQQAAQASSPQRNAIQQMLQALEEPAPPQETFSAAPIQSAAPSPPLYVPQSYEDRAEVEYIAVAETVENTLWDNKVYLFDFAHPNRLPRDFSFAREYCSKHAVDSIDANNIVEIQLPPVLVKDAAPTLKNVPWVRLVMVSLDDGTVSKLWCPVHDGRGNRFLGNIQRVSDYISQVVEFTRQELEPLMQKIETIHAMMELMGLSDK